MLLDASIDSYYNAVSKVALTEGLGLGGSLAKGPTNRRSSTR